MNVYSYDRRVTALAHEALYGHHSMETAYMVDDYPYGARLRCRIRYWLEKNGSKGFRFVSQTEDPRKLIWNKPKASVYNRFAGVMYLDGQQHVVWDGITEYTPGPKVLEFVKTFPSADYSLLKPFALGKVKWLEAYSTGKAHMTINGVPQQLSEEDVGRTRKELESWEAVAKHLHESVPG